MEGLSIDLDKHDKLNDMIVKYKYMVSQRSSLTDFMLLVDDNPSEIDLSIGNIGLRDKGGRKRDLSYYACECIERVLEDNLADVLKLSLKYLDSEIENLRVKIEAFD